MAKKSNWDLLKKKSPTETDGKYRDVYEDQQLERGNIEERQSFTGRLIVTIIVFVLVFILTYTILSFISFGVSSITNSGGVTNSTTQNERYSKNDTEVRVNDGGLYLYITEIDKVTPNGVISKYQALDANGKPFGKVYDKSSDVPEPDWYKAYVKQVEKNQEVAKANGISIKKNNSLSGEFFNFAPWKLFTSFIVALIVFVIMYQILKRNLDTQNLMSDTSDINQHHNDQHVALPHEIQRKFDWFPDVGAHSNVMVSSMISHVALQNKGLKPIQVAKRAKEDMYDEDGDLIYFKGELLGEDEDEREYDTLPLIDEAFMHDLFEASGLPSDKDLKKLGEKGSLRKFYDATKIEYNIDNKNREKQKGYNYVSDLINNDWILPDYEVQRPGGAYIVDTDPVNTMVLAITRAGKGQTVIEPTIDMWTRERTPNNMVINDPKGELLVKFYVKGTVRGFQVVQFNLINPMKTDIYNPLLMAAESAREGDFTKCALYVENIASVFFPLDGGEDPVWPQSANNAFKRAAYGLIDFYLEEEKELRAYAAATNMHPKELEKRLDANWGKVTLYNCYQLFVQLTSKKIKNPLNEFKAKLKSGEYDDMSDEEYERLLNEAENKAALWEDNPDIDLLTLYFNASAVIPKNQMRTLVDNANTSLKAMAGAEKMMASVYGIAITAMVRVVHTLKVYGQAKFV